MHKQAKATILQHHRRRRRQRLPIHLSHHSIETDEDSSVQEEVLVKVGRSFEDDSFAVAMKPALPQWDDNNNEFRSSSSLKL